MADGKTGKVVLLAAGPTLWDEQGRLGGRADLGLSPLGEQKAQAHARKLASEAVAVVLSGPDSASKAAAELIASACGAKVRVMPDLAEMDLGLWEGARREELLGRCPKACRGWEQDAAAVVPPEGESWTAVCERAAGAVMKGSGKARGSGGGTVVVVARPIVVGVLRCWFGKGSQPEVHRCEIGPDVFDRADRYAGVWSTSSAGWLSGTAVGLGILGIAGGLTGRG
jgi:broad specificity phosphatase PhoE